MAYRDQREFIQRLEKAGELKEKAEPYVEKAKTATTQAVEKVKTATTQAVEKIKGS